MFARRHSRAFLLDTCNRGTQFVEILKMVYPKADCLHEDDFDWLIECPETEQFLEWFCNTVGEENLLNCIELESYEKLVASGKPILEGEALEEALKTCSQYFEVKDVLQSNEAPSLEALEQEMQALKNQCTCHIKRHNKLQVRAASLKQGVFCSTEKIEKSKRELKKAHLKLEIVNFQSNDILSQFCKTARELAQCQTVLGNEQMRTSMATADLSHYLKSEETTTKALSGYFSKVMPSMHNIEADKTILERNWQGSTWEELISDITVRLAQEGLLGNKSTVSDKDSEEHKRVTAVVKSYELYKEQLAEKEEPKFTQKALSEEMDMPKTEDSRTWGQAALNDCQGGLKHAEADETEYLKENKLEASEELGRMKSGYMWSKMEVVMLSAKLKGISSSLQWAVKTLKIFKEKKMKEEKGELCLRIDRCQEQLYTLQTEVDQAKTQQLVPLLRGSAHLCLPILSGELDLEANRLGYLELMQEETADQMLGQLSHLELLKLLLMLEKKNMQQMGSLMEEMSTTLNERLSKLQDWQSCIEDSRFSIKQCPQTLMDLNDFTTLRLWKMLDKPSQKYELFRAYETLASQGSQLWQELRMLQVQLATPHTQLPKLESENKILYCLMYGDAKQLMLRAQELSEPLEQLSTTHAKLYQMLLDTQSDLKSKRKSLQSHFQKTMHSLYVHFFNNPDYLKDLVEDVEKKAVVSSYI
uniref:HAUS augmin-like complex subunit 3 N-terminal domain-containing protein n=1 Tax=Anolis carolinensis TaxID=28377 RepID=H9GQ15_ANOCA|nr:PREDICTED: HAUS augmin-like complex subunit 3 [Anolis carolinensis]XP_008118694.1 PREDICTED: HAUS augmin-like complex subunit 3 [Anolis carolinensis]|eukprot:XP_008118693.1 PREDICTED: HAUS augmin-like complex subunit 3 [Anolis carolinensis]